MSITHPTLSRIFADAAADNRAVFIGYLPAGYPTPEESRTQMRTLIDHGVDIIEVGIPFTDPILDGPTLQEASQQAIEAGYKTAQLFPLVADIVAHGGQAMVMSYYNPLLAYGLENFARDLAAAGGLGVILPDITPDYAGQWREIAERYGLATTFLVAPSTTPERLAMTCEATTGFIYAVSHMGVTGAQATLGTAALELVDRVRAAAPDHPVCVGLGVHRRDQAQALGAHCDGVIVGSALATAVREGRLAELTADLAAGMPRT